MRLATVLLFGVLVLSSTTMALSSKPTSDRLRLHYGVMFQHMGRLQLFDQTWVHTYQLDMPSLSDVPVTYPWHNKCVTHHRTNTSTQNPRCAVAIRLSKKILAYTDAMRRIAHTALNESLRAIADVVPHSQPPRSRSRSKRAFLSFLGDIAHSLTGVATDEEVQRVEHHLQLLARQLHLRDGAYNVSNHIMASVMGRTNKRMNNLLSAFKAEHARVLEIESSLAHETLWVEQVIGTLLQLATKEVHWAILTMADVARIQRTTNSLLHSRLSVDLLPPRALRTTIRQVSRSLEENHPRFKLLYTGLQYYYEHSRFLTSRRGNKIFISLFLPVTSKQSDFQLYRTLTFPVPARVNSSDATVVQGISEVFAYSAAAQRFMEFTEKQYRQCHDHSHKPCIAMPVEISIIRPTCTAAIFANRIDLAHQLCDFHLVPNGTMINALELSTGQLLLSRIPELTFSCQNKAEPRSGCHFCLAPIPCDCTVEVGPLFLPPRLDSCTDLGSVSQFRYTVNVAVLSHFFSSDDILDRLPNLLADEPLASKTAEFKLAEHKYKNAMGIDKQIRIKLRHAVDRAKANQIIYTNPADPIYLNNLADIPDQSVTQYIVYLALAFMVLLAISIVFLHRRVQLMRMQLIAHAHAAVAYAATTPPWVWTPSPTAPTTTELTLIDRYLMPLWDLEVIVLVVISALAAVLLFYIAKRFFSTRSTLYLSFSALHTTVRLPLVSFSAPPATVTLTHSQISPAAVSVNQSCCRAVVTLSWKSKGIAIENGLTGHRISLPRSLVVSPWTGRQLTTILRTNYLLHLYLVYQGTIYPIHAGPHQLMEPTPILVPCNYEASLLPHGSLDEETGPLNAEVPPILY